MPSADVTLFGVNGQPAEEFMEPMALPENLPSADPPSAQTGSPSCRRHVLGGVPGPDSGAVLLVLAVPALRALLTPRLLLRRAAGLPAAFVSCCWTASALA
jgi:hypothetical protein